MEPTALKSPEKVTFKPLDEKQKKETIKKISSTLSIKPHASINTNKFLITSFLSIILVLAIGLLGLLVTGGSANSLYSQNTNSSAKLQACPDAWYVNKMPGSDKGEYFIFEGERKELAGYDVEWIRQNCEVNTPESVY